MHDLLQIIVNIGLTVMLVLTAIQLSDVKKEVDTLKLQISTHQKG